MQQVEDDTRRGAANNCPFPCNLSSLLSMNCRAKAQGFAHRLQSQVRYNKDDATIEERLLVEPVQLAKSNPASRTYSLDDHHIENYYNNKTDAAAAAARNLRPIHVVTSEPTLHLSLPPQPQPQPPPPPGSDAYASPTDREQDSDVYYDFDLVTPPEDYVSPEDSRAVERDDDAIPEENEKQQRPEKPESGCVTSVTSPIMFSDNLDGDDFPQSDVESPIDEELSGSKASSDVNLETVRQLLVSSKRSGDTDVNNKPIKIKDDGLPDFVGVVKNPKFSAASSSSSSENSTSFSERGSSSEVENHPSEGEKGADTYDEQLSSSDLAYCLPPPSSYQIFSNTECDIEQGDALHPQSKCKHPRRKHKRKRSIPTKNESSESRDSPLLNREYKAPSVVSRIDSEKNQAPSILDLDKRRVFRSASLDGVKSKSHKSLRVSNSIEKCSYIVLSHSDDDANLRRQFEFDVAGRVSSKVYKQYSQNNKLIKDSSDTEILLSPREDLSFKVINIPDKRVKKVPEENLQHVRDVPAEEVVGETQMHRDASSLDESEIIQEINEAISILKKDGDDAIGAKLAKYEKEGERIFGTRANVRGEGSEQVANSPHDKRFHSRFECQNVGSASQLCEVCAEGPFITFRDGVRDKDNDRPQYKLKCSDSDQFNCKIKSDSSFAVKKLEMPRSKGRSKVKRSNPDSETPKNLSVTELSENGATTTDEVFSDSYPVQSALNSKNNQNKLDDSRVNHLSNHIASEVPDHKNSTKENGSSDSCIFTSGISQDSSVLKMLGLTRNGANDEDCDKNLTANCLEQLEHCRPQLSSSEISRGKESGAVVECNRNDNTNSKITKELSYKNGDSTSEHEVLNGLNSATVHDFPIYNDNLPRVHKSLDSGSSAGTRLDNLEQFSSEIRSGKRISSNINITENPVQNVIDCGGLSSETTVCAVRCDRNMGNMFSVNTNVQENGTNVTVIDETHTLNDVKTNCENDESTANEEIVPADAEGETSCKDFGSCEEEIVRCGSDGEEEVDQSLVEEIEVLPENEEGSEGEGVYSEEEEAESDEEVVIRGRFKNLVGYTERVRRSSEDDDGLPPPPTEVILIDYDEPLEAAPEEETEITNESDISEDLASELNRLNIEESTVKPPSDESETSPKEPEKDDDDDSNDMQQKIKRSSSLRCGKTPPGTPGRKKIVRFADCLGLDLADIRTFLDGVPNVPPSAFCDLQVEEDLGASGSSGTQSHPSYSSYSAAASAAAAVLQNQAQRILTPMFQQPGALPDFYDRLREQKVVLENVSVGSDLSVKGVVRVVNEDYHKKVFVRYTFDHWRNYHEATACYVDGSCDGFSDRFSFLLWGSFLQSNGSLVFCVKYCVNGNQYWDNNRGSNYVLQCYSSGPVRPLHGRPQNDCSLQQNHQESDDQRRCSFGGASSKRSAGRGGDGGGGGGGGHGYNSFADSPSTPIDPWATRFF